VVGEHLGVVLQREPDVVEGGLDVAHDRAETAARHAGGDVQAPGHVVVADDAERRLDAHVGHVAELDLTAAGHVDHQLADAGQAAAHPGRAPHHHVEDLLLLEQVADLDARQHGGGRPPHVARLDADLPRLGEVDLDLQGRLLDQALDLLVGDAVDAGEGLPHLLRLAAQHLQVLAVDAHHQAVARAAEDGVDPLLRVGQHLAVEPGVAVDHLLDAGDGLVVVGGRVDAHPQLAGVDADDLVRGHGAAHVGADVADPLELLQLLAGLRRDPGHLRVGRARRAVQADQQVGVLERGRQVLGEQRHQCQADQHHGHGRRRPPAPGPASARSAPGPTGSHGAAPAPAAAHAAAAARPAAGAGSAPA
jgi:hypothetical protein